VEIAPDAGSAMAALLDADHHYDAVLLDVMLPDKDGFAVATELREAGQFVPIMMLTARGRREDVLRDLSVGRTTISRSRSNCRSCWRGWAVCYDAANGSGAMRIGASTHRDNSPSQGRPLTSTAWRFAVEIGRSG
jgi:CheY-like chemotaxis protein